MFRAWEEVCSSPNRQGPLYNEMRQTSGEINSGYSPERALEGFIKRCGTKETARLGASILQNISRGNEELSLYLTSLSQEVWEDRKQNARKYGEQAKSKLLLPMGLIFLGIILLVAAPIMLSMGDMGF
jgi:tight adherence protein C